MNAHAHAGFRHHHHTVTVNHACDKTFPRHAMTHQSVQVLAGLYQEADGTWSSVAVKLVMYWPMRLEDDAADLRTEAQIHAAIQNAESTLTVAVKTFVEAADIGGVLVTERAAGVPIPPTWSSICAGLATRRSQEACVIFDSGLASGPWRPGRDSHSCLRCCWSPCHDAGMNRTGPLSAMIVNQGKLSLSNCCQVAMCLSAVCQASCTSACQECRVGYMFCRHLVGLGR